MEEKLTSVSTMSVVEIKSPLKQLNYLFPPYALLCTFFVKSQQEMHLSHIHQFTHLKHLSSSLTIPI